MTPEQLAAIERIAADGCTMPFRDAAILVAEVRRLRGIEAAARAFRETQRPYRIHLIAGQREHDRLFAMLDAKEGG